MPVKRTIRYSSPNTLVLAVSVAVVIGHRPLVGFGDDVEIAWKKLKRRHALKQRAADALARNASTSEMVDEVRRNRIGVTTITSQSSSDISSVLNKFRLMDEQQQLASSTDDVYSPHWRPPVYDKTAADYGRPKPGSLTEKRGIKAGHDIGREIVQVCEVIAENGRRRRSGDIWISFGQLFSIYQYISDKLVGMLLRARRHHLVAFDGEMLYQRRDDDKPIVLLKELDEIRALYTPSDDPAYCLHSIP